MNTRYKKWRPRFGLRTLLLLVVPVSLVLAFMGSSYREKQRRNRAVSAACDKGVDLVQHDANGYIVHFKNGNVTDSDLQDFSPAFAVEGHFGPMKVRCVDLNGSNVSDGAMRRFREEAPWCELRR